MRDVRLQFSKQGLLRFVSHLDLYRAVMRALRRTDIPFWYTEGFNPHPYVTFALPLPLGAESENDIMDIRVTDSIKNAVIAEKLNVALPEGLKVTDCYNPEDKYKQISEAEYLFFFESDTDAVRLSEVMDKGELLCEKRGKTHGRKTVKTVNLLEGNPAYSLSESDGQLVMKIPLTAGSEKNDNPVLLADALNKTDEHIRCSLVRRTRLFTPNGVFH